MIYSAYHWKIDASGYGCYTPSSTGCSLHPILCNTTCSHCFSLAAGQSLKRCLLYLHLGVIKVLLDINCAHMQHLVNCPSQITEVTMFHAAAQWVSDAWSWTTLLVPSNIVKVCTTHFFLSWITLSHSYALWVPLTLPCLASLSLCLPMQALVARATDR